jgi:hypothetical protein
VEYVIMTQITIVFKIVKEFGAEMQLKMYVESVVEVQTIQTAARIVLAYFKELENLMSAVNV